MTSNVDKRIVYTIILICAAVLSVIRTASYATILQPALMGYYAIALTVSTYAAYFQFGLLSGLDRETPVLLGKKMEEMSLNLISQAMSVIFLLQIIFAIGTFIVVHWIHFNDPRIAQVIELGVLLGLVSPLSQIVLLRLRSEQRIIAFSVLQLAISFSTLFGGLLLIWWIGYAGAIWAAILVNISIFIYGNYKLLKPIQFCMIRWEKIAYLVKIGLPMTLASVLLSLQIGMDRLFVIQSGLIDMIGIYQVGVLPLIAASFMSSIVSTYINPKLLFEYGSGKGIRAVYWDSLKMSGILFFISLIMLPAVIFLFTVMIKIGLPLYVSSLSFVSVFSFSMIMIVSNVTPVIFNVVNKQYLLLFITAVTTGISFVLCYMVSNLGLNIIWFAYINLFVQFIYFLACIIFAYFVVKNRDSQLVLSTSRELSQVAY